MKTGTMKAWLVALGTTALAGCTISTGVGDEPVGALTVDWTVASVKDAANCDDFGATQLEIVVYEETGGQVAAVTADCADFETTLELSAGGYTADVTLLDGRNGPVSTTLTLDDLSILPDKDLVVNIDFPSDSILAPR